MYNNAVEQVKGSQQTPVVSFRLAEVKSISSNRAYVQFVGDDSPSTKAFPYMVGYNPTVGDKVVMFNQGMTYIIAGKYKTDAPASGEYYLLKKDADTYYLTQATADTLYAAISHDHDKLVKGSVNLTLSTTELQPSADETISLGDSSKKYKEVYAKSHKGTEVDVTNVKSTNFNGAWVVSPGTAHSPGLEIASNSGGAALSPVGTGGTTLGLSTNRLTKGYFTNLDATNFEGKWHGGSTGHNLHWQNSTLIVPQVNNDIDFGSSYYQFNNIYAKQFYQNGTAISTSDRNKKKDIKDISENFVSFFKKLRPVTFKFKKKWSDSGRTHMGFIAQEVETAAEECEIDTKDLAFLCKDPDGNYGLRYDEIIALQTKVIQDLIKRVETLEGRINDLTV